MVSSGLSSVPVHPALAVLSGAGLVPAQGRVPGGDSVVQAWDSIAGRYVDSVVVRSPLPDPLVPIVQWAFQRPGWVMISGIILGAVAAVAVLIALWRRRRRIAGWLVTRDRGVKLALVCAVGAVLLLVVGTGVKGYDYMMRDNDFCRGCHIFVPSGQLFVRPDTGTYLLVNKLEGKHDSLSCHSCHPFEIKAQSKELFYWMVARPDRIPPHGKVPRDVCERCHVTGAAKKTWQRIATTAGHRTHLESDSSALKHVECLTCHAESAHRFTPADTTCAQKGCHLTDEVRIRLGRMAARFDRTRMRPLPNEEKLYCNSCHQFTADAQFVSRDSAQGALTPGSRQCFGCHEMRVLFADFDPARDPHSGSCGMCHNPHTDVKPGDALKSCADAKCHGNWRDVPFHTGKTHRAVAEQCKTCHQVHSARVDASDCVGCHEQARRAPRSHLRPPLPFDTTKALRRTSSREPPGGLITPGRALGQGSAPPEPRPPGSRGDVSASSTDSFPHARHSRLACLTCHDLRSKEKRLTFEPPRGCQICHHQRSAQANCSSCHQPDELTGTRPVQVSVAVPRHDPRRRTVQFAHQEHDSLSCTSCHAAPVTLEPVDSAVTCTGCHAAHHAESRDCAACHRALAITAPHRTPVQAHTRCDACHTRATVANLVPTRAFCLVCHQPEQDHYSPQECSACHFQLAPGELKARLTSAGAAR